MPPADEEFTPEERRALAPWFTNTDRPIFALTNLPETVKGALFARYSRSAKSLRRLFLDEFLGEVTSRGDRLRPAEDRSPTRGSRAAVADPPEGRYDGAHEVGAERAARLYSRVLNEYGDDSVAQLGAAHVACEGVSNI